MNSSTILVIDDELHIRQFLRAAFEFEGFAVQEASDAEEGIRSATLKPPDLIILDLGLPDRDGSSVIERLRSWSNVPIIVLTVRSREREANQRDGQQPEQQQDDVRQAARPKHRHRRAFRNEAHRGKKVPGWHTGRKQVRDDDTRADRRRDGQPQRRREAHGAAASTAACPVTMRRTMSLTGSAVDVST